MIPCGAAVLVDRGYCGCQPRSGFRMPRRSRGRDRPRVSAGGRALRIPGMSRRRLVTLIAVASLIGMAGGTHNAVVDYRRPLRPWVPARVWYEDALGVAMNAIVAGACVVWLYRTRRRDQGGAGGGSPPPEPWRDKVELRVVLYAFAAFGLLHLPLGVYHALRAMSRPPPWGETFWSALTPDAWMGPLIAACIVVYDRRRVVCERREAREAAGRCVHCGYDLRATPLRCPECGTTASSSQAG